VILLGGVLLLSVALLGPRDLLRRHGRPAAGAATPRRVWTMRIVAALTVVVATSATVRS
jgi:hypothetical protein